MANLASTLTSMNFFDDKALLNRLQDCVKRNRKVVFMLGSPLTAPEDAGRPGVPDVTGMIGLIRETYRDDDEASASLETLLHAQPRGRYQAAFEHLRGHRGQDVVNQVIVDAVLRARRADRPLPYSPNGIDEDFCERHEKTVDEWHIRPSLQALAMVCTSFDTFGHTILTSNFDPLIEIAIRKAGGKAYRTVLHSDGNLDQTAGVEGCRVVHIHGYWYGADTLHAPHQLSLPRPRLSASLQNLFRNRTVVVLAYGGWDDVFMSALMQTVSDDQAKSDILWAFQKPDDMMIRRESEDLLGRLLPGIQRGRVALYKGINVHNFCEQLWQKLQPLVRPGSRPPDSGRGSSSSVSSTPSSANSREQLIKDVEKLLQLTGHRISIRDDLTRAGVHILAEETNTVSRKSLLVLCDATTSPMTRHQLESTFVGAFDMRARMGGSVILMHVAKGGHEEDAQRYAQEVGIDACSLRDLEHRMVNFKPYIRAIQSDRLRQLILREYQPTKIHFANERKASKPALEFLTEWLAGPDRWLTLLGDYGVGKSWTLKRLLYQMVDEYDSDPMNKPLPLFVPLQQFTKAFTFENLMNGAFSSYGLTGIHYPAFQYLAAKGRIVFLLDSFDEMAQTLHRDAIRENLKELLFGVEQGSKAIMTSRPTYFENRTEPLLVMERAGVSMQHPDDQEHLEYQSALSRSITGRLQTARFARLNDLSDSQRDRLFSIVLDDKPKALAKIRELHVRFRQLGNIAQKAVIARLLTTVAETLADGTSAITPDGYTLLPDTLEVLNQAKVFQIVVANLIRRDAGIGHLTAVDRQRFLRTFAIYLQRPGQPFFAEPAEIRNLVQGLFHDYLRNSDTPNQLLENYYRTCRRHSGLTTEGQFHSTSGDIDTPVDEQDQDSRVGFSHNSLREYLVAEAIADHLLKGREYPNLSAVTITELIGDLLVDISEYEPTLREKLQAAYHRDIALRALWFRILYSFLRKDSKKHLAMLGVPVQISQVDLCDLNMSGFDLRSALVEGCIAADTDFRNTDLRDAKFPRTVLERVMFDQSRLDGADFSEAEILSVYVFDDYNLKTLCILERKDARQWLFSHGAMVQNPHELNPYLGRQWYEAAREIVRTLVGRMAGTHQELGLSRGVKHQHKEFAEEFVSYLKRKGVLEVVTRADRDGGDVVRVHKDYRAVLDEFDKVGKIGEVLQPFFNKKLGISEQTLPSEKL